MEVLPDSEAKEQPDVFVLQACKDFLSIVQKIDQHYETVVVKKISIDQNYVSQVAKVKQENYAKVESGLSRGLQLHLKDRLLLFLFLFMAWSIYWSLCVSTVRISVCQAPFQAKVI